MYTLRTVYGGRGTYVSVIRASWGARILVSCTAHAHGLFPRKTNYQMWRKLFFFLVVIIIIVITMWSWFRFSFGSKSACTAQATRTITITRYTDGHLQQKPLLQAVQYDRGRWRFSHDACTPSQSSRCASRYFITLKILIIIIKAADTAAVYLIMSRVRLYFIIMCTRTTGI
jgi:hypothetical protein